MPLRSRVPLAVPLALAVLLTGCSSPGASGRTAPAATPPATTAPAVAASSQSPTGTSSSAPSVPAPPSSVATSAGGRPSADAPPPTSAGPSGVDPSSSSGAALKPPLTGLLDRQGVPDASNPNAAQITGVVLNLDWAQVEPRPGQLDAALVERGLADAEAFGRRAGHPVRVRLRIVGGLKAPDWVKDAAGRVHVVHKAGADDQGVEDFTGDLPRFWTDAYGQAYADLQRRLAERFDGDPRLADVVIGRCVTVWAEPFVRQGDDGVRKPLFDAGFTPDADARCFAQQIDAHRVWTTTRSTLSLSPYSKLSRERRLGQDLEVTLASLRRCRDQLGERCVLANNSIRWPLQGDEYDRLYAAIIGAGRPITFQSAKKTRIGDLAKTLDWAAGTARACSVELPSGYAERSFAPTAALASARERLAANCP